MIGDGLDEDEEDHDAGEDEVRKAELLVLLDLGEDEECIRRRRDCEEEQ